MGKRVKQNNLSLYLQLFFLFVLVHHCSRNKVSCMMMMMMCQSTDTTPPSESDVTRSSQGGHLIWSF